MRCTAMWLVMVAWVAGIQASRADQVICTADGKGNDRCNILVPNVLAASTDYPTVHLAPGDIVTVAAVSGCAQTGGVGKTWKNFLAPQGPDADHLYHGLIGIPGSTAGLVELRSVFGQALPPSTGGVLTLGYEDDDLTDNGYWSPDSGTNNQCGLGSPNSPAASLGKAQVTLDIKRAAQPPAPASVYGQCVSVGTNRDHCRIDRPDVTLAEEPYSSIQFRPGDIVLVSAGGCAQTGGKGNTWKIYAGTGSNYFGSISIPGTTNGLVPLSSVMGATLPPSTGGPLLLGYTDDFGAFLDNGYWSPDNGSGGECQGASTAFVTLDILRAAAPSGPHIDLDALEVVQAIQNVSQTVPLVAGKITYARAYVTDPGPDSHTIKGVLRVTPAGGVPVDIASTSALKTSSNQTLRTRRETLSNSLNFILPNAAIAAGNLHLELLSLTDTVTGSPLGCNGCSAGRDVTFATSPVLRVTAIGLMYTSGTRTFTPRTVDFQLLGSWLGRAYPTQAPEYQSRVASLNDVWPFDCEHANAEIAAIRANDMANGDNPRIHYYGMVFDGGGTNFMQGCATAPDDPDPTAVGSGPTGNPATSNLNGIRNAAGMLTDTDASFGDWYGGHELGHTYGRNHPGFCFGNTLDDPNYPFPLGQISDNQGSYVGLDVGDLFATLNPAALPGVSNFEVMSYCQPEWLSTYSYQAIRQRLIEEDAALQSDRGGSSSNGNGSSAGTGPGAGGNPGSGAGGARGSGASGSTHNSGNHTLPNIQPVTAQNLVHIVALLDLHNKTGSFLYVEPVASGVLPVKSLQRVTIRASAANGQKLRDYSVPYHLTTDKSPNEHSTASVDTTLQLDPQVESLTLLLGAKQVAKFHGLTSPPSAPRQVHVVRTTQPQTPAQTPEEIYWLEWAPITARSGESITFTVEMLDGLWRTVAIGSKRNRIQLTAEQAHRRLRVTATNGLRNSERVVIGGL